MRMKFRPYIHLKKRPYELLGVMALMLFLVSFVNSNSTLDINLHDGYYVIANASLCRIASGALLFLWSMGLLFRSYVWSLTLSWVQVALTLISVIAFLKLAIIGTGYDGIARRYYAFSEFEQRNQWFSTTSIYVFMLLLFFAGQVVFIVNVIVGFLRKISCSGSSK